MKKKFQIHRPSQKKVRNHLAGLELLSDGKDLHLNRGIRMSWLNDFQENANELWFGGKVPKPDLDFSFIVPALGLSGEAGEVLEKFKKYYRGDNIDLESVIIELGDVLFYLAILADRLGTTLEEIAKIELNKIYGRIERGTRRGSGDER